MATILTYQQQSMFRICADADDFVSLVRVVASSLPIDYRAQAGFSVFENYLKIELGRPTRIGRVFPNEVYQLFVSKFDEDSWHYDDLVVDADHLPPQNVSVVGDEISCDEHVTKTTHLFKWNTTEKIFEDTEVTGSVDGGRVTFSGLANGYYVLGYTGNEFCTVRLQVNA